MSLKKTGAEALDDLVLSMTASPVEQVHQLLSANRVKEAVKLADALSVSDIQKLAQDLGVMISQSENEASPPSSEVSEEHKKEEGTSKGEPHGGEPSKEEAEINEVEGEGGSEKATRAPEQIEEDAEPPSGKKEASEDEDAKKEDAKKEDAKEEGAKEEGAKEDTKPDEEAKKDEGSEEEDKKEEKIASYKKQLVKAYLLGAEYRTNKIKEKLNAVKGGK
jgi:hypothetical protein